jgi:Concanavalin A-like lectin/glucanases superfamily
VSRIAYNRWTHVAVVKQEQKVKLYINGILDSIIIINGASVANNSPLYIGNHPDYVSQCEINGYLDELKFYRRALSEGEIQAEGSAAFGTLESSAVHLGCIDCDVFTAKKSCFEGFHLCTSMELHSLAYQIAKTQGWVCICMSD